MKSVRTSPLAFRFDPLVKEALRLSAEREGRSMANMIEWLVRQHCAREGISWPGDGVVSVEGKAGVAARKALSKAVAKKPSKGKEKQ